jgi:hypothetical protein
MQEILKIDDGEKQRLEAHLKVVLEKSRSIKKEDLEELKKDYGPRFKREDADIDDGKRSLKAMMTMRSMRREGRRTRTPMMKRRT